jgi:Ni,Fe-hydrogenase III large subunit
MTRTSDSAVDLADAISISPSFAARMKQLAAWEAQCRRDGFSSAEIERALRRELRRVKSDFIKAQIAMLRSVTPSA